MQATSTQPDDIACIIYDKDENSVGKAILVALWRSNAVQVSSSNFLIWQVKLKLKYLVPCIAVVAKFINGPSERAWRSDSLPRAEKFRFNDWTW